jgi:hypothetical protein
MISVPPSEIGVGQELGEPVRPVPLSTMLVICPVAVMRFDRNTVPVYRQLPNIGRLTRKPKPAAEPAIDVMFGRVPWKVTYLIETPDRTAPEDDQAQSEMLLSGPPRTVASSAPGLFAIDAPLSDCARDHVQLSFIPPIFQVILPVALIGVAAPVTEKPDDDAATPVNAVISAAIESRAVLRERKTKVVNMGCVDGRSRRLMLGSPPAEASKRAASHRAILDQGSQAESRLPRHH